MCLGCTNDVSIITTSVVVLIVDNKRVVTIGCAIDELDPSLLTPLINIVPKTITKAQILFNEFMGIIIFYLFIHYFLILFAWTSKAKLL